MNRIKWSTVWIRVPRRDLIVTKCNISKIATGRSRLIDLEKPLLRGFWCTCNPLCGIWLRSPHYEFMLWNQPFVFASLLKGEVVIPGANSVQGPCQWPSQAARVKKSEPGLYLWPRWRWAWKPLKARNEKMPISLQQGHQSKFWAHFLLFNFWFYLPRTLKMPKKPLKYLKSNTKQLFCHQIPISRNR